MAQLRDYCDKYNLPFEHIVTVMSDLKVVPMIRGKSFEYSVSDALKSLLGSDWNIENPNINPQSGDHDADILVSKKGEDKKIRVECKLSAKGKFRHDNVHITAQVKCMRSRTVSDNEQATRMARAYGIPRELLVIHADNYRESDFDYVITSLGNVFWDTIDNNYQFNGSKGDFQILNSLFPSHFHSYNSFKTDSFNFLLFAKSSDIAANERNDISCRREKCKKNGTDTKCGFIPDYPIIHLDEVANGTSKWKMLDNLKSELINFYSID